MLLPSNRKLRNHETKVKYPSSALIFCCSNLQFIILRISELEECNFNLDSRYFTACSFPELLIK